MSQQYHLFYSFNIYKVEYIRHTKLTTRWESQIQKYEGEQGSCHRRQHGPWGMILKIATPATL